MEMKGWEMGRDQGHEMGREAGSRGRRWGGRG